MPFHTDMHDGTQGRIPFEIYDLVLETYGPDAAMLMVNADNNIITGACACGSRQRQAMGPLLISTLYLPIHHHPPAPVRVTPGNAPPPEERTRTVKLLYLTAELVRACMNPYHGRSRF